LETDRATSGVNTKALALLRDIYVSKRVIFALVPVIHKVTGKKRKNEYKFA